MASLESNWVSHSLEQWNRSQSHQSHCMHAFMTGQSGHDWSDIRNQVLARPKQSTREMFVPWLYGLQGHRWPSGTGCCCCRVAGGRGSAQPLWVATAPPFHIPLLHKHKRLNRRNGARPVTSQRGVAFPSGRGHAEGSGVVIWTLLVPFLNFKASARRPPPGRRVTMETAPSREALDSLRTLCVWLQYENRILQGCH